jgi:hypothetical protein
VRLQCIATEGYFEELACKLQTSIRDDVLPTAIGDAGTNAVLLVAENQK